MPVRFERQNIGNATKFVEIMNLPDADRDGYSDFADFSFAFANKSMSKSDLSEVYRTADMNGDGLISFAEWTPFYKLFVYPYLMCDLDRDFKVKKEGSEGCIRSFQLKYPKFQNYLDQRGEKDEFAKRIMVYLNEETGMKFNNYLLLKRVIMAYSNCTVPGTFSIQKPQMLCLSKYLTFENPLSQNQLNNIFDTVSYFSEEEEVEYADQPNLSFLGVLNLFAKRRQYFKLISSRRRTFVNQTDIMWNIIEKNINFDELMVFDIFSNFKSWGFDFRSFYILMKFEDFSRLKGKIDLANFNQLLDKKSFMGLVKKEIDKTNLDWTLEMFEEAEADIAKAPPQNSPPQVIDAAKASIEALERGFISTDLPPTPPPPSSFLQLNYKIKMKQSVQAQKIPLPLQMFKYWTIQGGAPPNKKARESVFNCFDSNQTQTLNSFQLLRLTYVAMTFQGFSNFQDTVKTVDLMMKDMLLPVDLPDELYFQIKQLRNFDTKLPITFYEMCVFEEEPFLFKAYVLNPAEEVKLVKENSLDEVFKRINMPLRTKEKEYSKAGEETFNPDFAIKLSLKMISQLIQLNKLPIKK